MHFLEQDLENIIYNASAEAIWNRGLHVDLRGFRKRQLYVGKYGVADIVFANYRIPPPGFNFESGLHITVMELKKDDIGVGTFLQAAGYCKGISRYLLKRGFTSFIFDIVLIGRGINTSDSFCYLPELIGYNGRFGAIYALHNYTYDYGFDGIQFKEQSGFKLTEEGF